MTDEKQAAEKEFNNTFHKVPAEVSRDWWDRIWDKALAWSGHVNYRARYEALRDHYMQQHPRITSAAVDAFVDGLVAGEGVGAGPEPAQSTQDSVQGQRQE